MSFRITCVSRCLDALDPASVYNVLAHYKRVAMPGCPPADSVKGCRSLITGASSPPGSKIVTVAYHPEVVQHQPTTFASALNTAALSRHDKILNEICLPARQQQQRPAHLACGWQPPPDITARQQRQLKKPRRLESERGHTAEDDDAATKMRLAQGGVDGHAPGAS